MENKIKYWDDLSDQEKELAIAFGRENEYSHEKPVRETTSWKVNLPYEKREDVPEQARELWDMFHR